MKKNNYAKLASSISNLEEQYELYKTLDKKEHYKLYEALDKKRLFKAHQKASETSCVKCFEICYDTLWKHIKRHLVLDPIDIPNSPTEIFRVAHENGLIDAGMQERLIKYNRLRAESAHDYSIKKAGAVLAKVEYFIEDATEVYKAMISAQ